MIIKVLIDNNTTSELLCEWGLSFYIEYEGHKILLDTGSGSNFAENAKRMGIDLSEIEYGVLSHAHYDHADGIPTFFRENKNARFYIRKGAGENCYGKKGFFRYRYNGILPGTLETYSDRIVYAEGDYELLKGVYLIPHKTINLEKIAKKVGLYVKDNGRMFPDDFAHEQSLVFETPKGLVVFNSCSHGGVDHIMTEIEATFPEQKIYAFIGGFHLFKSSKETVKELAVHLKNREVEKIITGHCTGEEAFQILKRQLGDVVCQMYSGMELVIE